MVNTTGEEILVMYSTCVEASLLAKHVEEKHSTGDCYCGEMQLSGNAADWGMCSSRNFSVTSLVGNWRIARC